MQRPKLMMIPRFAFRLISTPDDCYLVLANARWGTSKTLLILACMWLAACGARSGLGELPSEAQDSGLPGEDHEITPPATRPLPLSLGTSYGCAILEDRGVSCWGAVEPGGTKPHQIPPRRVSGLTNVRHLSVGYFAACAVDQEGSVWCWGTTVVACAVGQERTTADGVPRQIMGIDDAVTVETSGTQTCVLRRDETVWCWGEDIYKAVGRPEASPDPADRFPCYLTPQPVPGVHDIVQISLSDAHSCALRRDSAVLCWGRVNDRYGPDSSTPVIKQGLGQVRTIATAQGSTLAITKEGRVLSWGDNQDGILGLGTATEFIDTPSLVADVTAVEAHGSYHTLCMVLKGGQVACSGVNHGRQPGSPDGYISHLFSTVPGATEAVDVAVGTWESCARRADNTYICWGTGPDNQFRQATAFDPSPR